MRDFQQLEWDAVVEDDCRQLIRLATREDLDRWHDWTTVALVPLDAPGSAAVVARQAGRICGLRAARLALETMDYQAVWHAELDDGAAVAAGTHAGDDRRTRHARCWWPNGRCSTFSAACLAWQRWPPSMSRRWPAPGRGSTTRGKRLPAGGGWKSMRFAVGGGHNHRTGLFDAILIKDNHLALGQQPGGGHFTPAEAVLRARNFCQDAAAGDPRASLLVEVEVDSLEQLDQVLPVGPDIVLLDNMSVEQLSQAVRRRDALGVPTELEASGGVTLATVRQIAETGVDRISVGALTHSAVSLDVALDWES